VALSAALLLAVLVAGLLAMWWRLERDARALANSLKRVGLRALDTQRRVDAQVRLARAQQFTESAVDLTSATVRAVHRRIAAIPFGLLARTPEAKAQVLRAQALHDETAEAVYGGINAINRLVGRGVRRGLGQHDAVPPAAEDPSDESRPKPPVR
jgi:hypothetical protein|tara:strand:+ start:378 stop:842 length:465 start_codon:yes stop_codon:yes gene_type:complete